jgi:hypothetical protein
MKGVCPVIIQVKKLLEIGKIFIIFTTLTIFFYGLILWIGDKVEQINRDEDPKGRAVKVSQIIDHPSMNNIEDFKNRLYFYYWFGE